VPRRRFTGGGSQCTEVRAAAVRRAAHLPASSGRTGRPVCRRQRARGRPAGGGPRRRMQRRRRPRGGSRRGWAPAGSTCRSPGSGAGRQGRGGRRVSPLLLLGAGGSSAQHAVAATPAHTPECQQVAPGTCAQSLPPQRLHASCEAQWQVAAPPLHMRCFGQDQQHSPLPVAQAPGIDVDNSHGKRQQGAHLEPGLLPRRDGGGVGGVGGVVRHVHLGGGQAGGGGWREGHTCVNTVATSGLFVLQQQHIPKVGIRMLW
jgi:hypothetical protein